MAKWTVIFDIGKAILKFFKLILEIFKFIIMLIKNIKEIWKYIINPIKIIKDIISSIKITIRILINFILDKILGLKYLYKINNKNKDLSNKNKNKNKTHICISKKIIEILLLILCPPFFILHKKGYKGFIYFIICTLLTFFFYIPGLIYSLLFFI